jgi:hypothetical protein
MKLFSRPGIILIVALLCFIAGAFAGGAVGNHLYPNHYLKGVDHETEKDAVSSIAIACAIAGSIAGATITTIATRKRTSVPS